MNSLEVLIETAGYSRRPVLADLVCRVPARSMTLLVGPNGSGKSTLLKAMVGALPISNSRVILGSTVLPNATPATAWNSGITLVPQGGAVFGGLTVRDNLALGATRLLHAERAKREKETLQWMPFLETLMNRKAAWLSGGERQLVGVARALIQRPKVLLIDEPLLGLGEGIGGTLLTAVKRLCSYLDMTVLMAEHNLRAAIPHAEHILVMQHGRLVRSQPAPEMSGEFIRSIFVSPAVPSKAKSDGSTY